ncbi:hypothetical protein GCM10010840_29900 [Deinococcus aerolatus]|uniref:Uncharacterized protein n=1 Tax=Deinococcus aerolatus TaxID=522487 RepID=A0ABQ2GDQ8_9DEIO|nr:hypothetical protein [Deinococcus aerolatus]GGL89916.1 hypothetical protein GCM10010840_29900 [Deinococcus aerolatus]
MLNRDVEALSVQERSDVLLDLLKVNRMVTSGQLERWGLAEAAGRLGLPSRLQSVRTQVTQPSSLRNLRFVGTDERLLRRPERELKHWAALSEVWWTMWLGKHGVWEVLDGRGREGRRMPDARVSGLWWEPWAIEIDCGYDKPQIQRKLLGIAEAGYRRVVWATTVHDRVRRVGWLIDDLWRDGKLTGLEEYEIRFCNFWISQDPYQNRPRCYKRNDFFGQRQVILELAYGDVGEDDGGWQEEDEVSEDDLQDGHAWEGEDAYEDKRVWQDHEDWSDGELE